MSDKSSKDLPAISSVGGRKHWIELSDLNWPVLFVGYTAAGLISADTVYTSEMAGGKNLLFFYPALWELTGHYTVFALLPLIILGFSRLPIERSNWYWMVPVHILISMGFGAIHTLLMLVSRREIYSLLGLGVYDYGQMGYRFVMEYHKQFLHYWIVYTVLRVLAHYRESREQERQAAALQLKTSELQRQLAQVQLQALRTQLNPHFLFNTLNMVSSAMYEDVDRADHMLEALSRMLRMSLEENVGTNVPLRRELEFVRCAAELIRARFQERVDIDIKCDPSAEDVLVPSLVLHTLIENAIKHHDLEQSTTIRVQTRIERHDSMLDIHVLDNGPGIKDLERAMENGVGLSNTRQRLRALYGEDHLFEIKNRPEGGLDVHLALPIEGDTVAKAV
jgi:sensor histidine kinase YesM